MKIDIQLATSPGAWSQALDHLGGAHLLQSWEWGESKEQFGWRAERRLWVDPSNTPLAAAQVLRREISIAGARACVLYCPKGPTLDWGNTKLRRQVLADLAAIAVDQGAIQLKADPDVIVGTGIPGEPDAESNPQAADVMGELEQLGWMPSAEQIQFRHTLLDDLKLDEESLLAAMKQKTRYNVRLAQRRGVTVRQGTTTDLHLLYKMYAETAIRDRFTIRSQDYYLAIWGAFLDAGMLVPMIAEVESDPVAAVLPFAFGDRAWYLYGMSRDAHRDLMPNHLLQWEAMRWAKQRGCSTYDLWGAPDVFDPSDSLWGVFRFKSGFPARVVRTIGAWDYAPRRWLYHGYHRLTPVALSVMRRFGRLRTERALG